MRILGIDPGTATTGFGLINVEGNRISIIEYGVIKTKASEPLPKRLKDIYDGMLNVVLTHKPDACSIENIFMHENARTALILGHSRAVALLAAVNQGIPVYEYTPREVKQSVVGNGNASKEQVQYMIKMLLNLKEVPKPNDAADGCAAAICHFNHLNRNRVIKV